MPIKDIRHPVASTTRLLQALLFASEKHCHQYAARFCGTATLRDATREQIEGFIQHISELACNPANLAGALDGSQEPAEKKTEGATAVGEEAA